MLFIRQGCVLQLLENRATKKWHTKENDLLNANVALVALAEAVYHHRL